MFGILFIVFGYIAKFGGNIDHYPLYLLLGIVLWNFFAEATSFGLQSIVGRGDLIRKINFPKYIIVISGSISALINLGFSLIVVLLFIIFSGVELRPIALLLPFLVIELYLFALALAFILSALYVKYRDISHIWELVMQAGIYATPIIYPLSLVTDISPLAAKVMLLSPIAQIIQDARYVLITPSTETLLKLTNSGLISLIPLAIICLAITVGGLYFQRSSKYFAENV